MIRLRGIYSTALAGLLSEAGYTFSDISEKTRSRIPGLRFSSESVRATIKDLEHHKGIVIIGEEDAVANIYSIIESSIGSEYSIFVRDGPYTVYRARIIEAVKGGYTVELPGRRKGFLRTFQRHTIGDVVTAHVVKPAIFSPVLEEGIAVSGDYVRVVEGKRHSVSEHIHDPQFTLELLTLASTKARGKWGVRFRSSCRGTEILRIMEELEKLLGEAERVKQASEKIDAPALVRAGESIALMYFSFKSFERFDTIRRRYYPTVQGHHLVKSLGDNNISNKVDELEASASDDSVNFSENYFDELIRVLSTGTVRVVHEKAMGRGYTWLAKASISPTGYIQLEREVESNGWYDGLRVEKVKGDRIFTLTYPSSRFLVHKYVDKEDNLKGIYVNLNTPLDFSLTPPSLWYLDLALDIAWTPGEEARIIDQAEFEVLRVSGLYPKGSIEHYLEAARKIRELLSHEPLKLLTGPDFLVRLQDSVWGDEATKILMSFSNRLRG
ncbi:MAG: DUF402 domain-containing protein [Infirmifilum sp.]|uniref:DUF402 domain-containing protein n=1 Tax=Infirmifilum sp. TaxID=2856575 RepID=UPI003D121EB0